MKDIKYIIKRVVIGVAIALIIMTIKSCNVNALTLTSPESYMSINNVSSFPYTLDNYATYRLEYAYNADFENYNYLVFDTCTQGTYKEWYIYSDSCTSNCFEPGVITSYKVGTCSVNNTTGNHVIFQVRVKKASLDTNTLYYRSVNNIRLVGTGKTIFNGFYGSTDDVISVLASGQQNATDIINNQNQNATDIINNQNNNTNSINNNISNGFAGIGATMAEEYQKSRDEAIQRAYHCEPNTVINSSFYKLDNKYLNSSGSYVDSNNWHVTDYIFIRNVNITINSIASTPSVCFYGLTKNLLSCVNYGSMSSGSITLPSNAVYVRFSIYDNGNGYPNPPTITGTVCKNYEDLELDEQKKLNQAVESLNSNITDDSSPSLSGLGSSAGWLPAGPVDSLLNLPLSLLNNLNDNLSNSCQPAVLDIPYVNSQLTLPCLSTIYQEIGISSWINTVGYIASAFILLSYFIRLYHWVDDTLTLREQTQQDSGMWGGM